MSWRKKLEGPAGAVLAAGLALGMGLMGFDNNVQLGKARELARNGIQTTGTVTAMRASGRKARTYYVSYRYRAGGQERGVEAKVDSDSYYALAEGMTIPVRFDPDNPRRAISEGELARLESWGERFGPFAGTVLFAFGFISKVAPSWTPWSPRPSPRKPPDSPRKSKSPSSGSRPGDRAPRGSGRKRK